MIDLKTNTLLTKYKKVKKGSFGQESKTISFSLSDDIFPFINSKFSNFKHGEKSKYINDAIRTKLMLENNPKQFMIELKRQMPGLFSWVNRKISQELKEKNAEVSSVQP